MAYNLTATLKLVDNMSKPLRQVTNVMASAKKASDTFRDSQGRLRDAQGHFAKSTSGATKSLSSFSSGTASAIKAASGLVATLGSAVGAAKLLDSTLGEAMRYEQSTVVIDAMFNNSNAAKQYAKMLDQFAIDSPLLNSSDMFANSKSFINLSSDIGQLEQMWNLTERLLAVDPVQGVDGAVLALRELFSGDTQSLVERFELPRQALNDIKNLPLDQQLAELDELFNKMRMTNNLVEKMGDSSLGVINRIKEALSVKFRNAGLEALEQLKPVILDIERAVSGGALDSFFNTLTKGFGAVAGEAAKFSGYIKTNWPTIKQNFNSTMQALAPIGNALLMVYNAAKKVGDYIIQNWSAIQPVVVGLTYAFVGLKVIGTVTTVIRAMAPVVGLVTKTFRLLSTTVKVARVAFTAVRLAMLLFPGGWIIRAIGAVIAGGVALYRNWDTVKEKAGQLWAKMKDVWQRVKGTTADTWNSVKTTIADTMSSAKENVANFFEPLLSFIDKAKGAWDKFTGALKKFKLPKLSLPSIGGVFGGGGGKSKTPKKAFHGEEFVSKNLSPYLLHRGEMVLTREQADRYRAQRGGAGNNVYLTVNYDGSGPLNEQQMDVFGEFLVRKLTQARSGGA